MTREEQLKFCRVCKRRKNDLKQGIICSLTGRKADFEGICESYEEDIILKTQFESTKNGILNEEASIGKRFANYIIDLIFFYVFSFLFGMFLGLFLYIIAPSALVVFEEENILINYLFGFIAGMIYYSAFEVLTGRTIGKFITKTKVVDESGNSPDFGTIVVRSLCRFIPFEQFSFLGDTNTGWHDRLSKTRVVNA